jgi:hypothetical protein
MGTEVGCFNYCGWNGSDLMLEQIRPDFDSAPVSRTHVDGEAPLRIN